MTFLRIILDGDGAFPEMGDDLGVVEAISRLRGGMQSGKSSVCVKVLLADGSFVFGEASLEQIGAAIDAFRIAESAEAFSDMKVKGSFPQ